MNNERCLSGRSIVVSFPIYVPVLCTRESSVSDIKISSRVRAASTRVSTIAYRHIMENTIKLKTPLTKFLQYYRSRLRFFVLKYSKKSSCFREKVYASTEANERGGGGEFSVPRSDALCILVQVL